MTRSSRNVGLLPLRAAIAASPIMAPAPSASKACNKARDFADWCGYQSADIDVVILDWLRSQARRPAALS